MKKMEFGQVPEGWVEFGSWGVDIADEQSIWEGVNIVHSEGSVEVKGLPWDIVEKNRLAILAGASFWRALKSSI